MATLVQLSYALSLAKLGSFQKAAKASFVTQPTLSMQIQKLEEELGVIVFDRSRKPIAPTETGRLLLDQFRRVMVEYERIGDILNQSQGEVSGDFKLGIIPTMAAYIVPLFLRPFMKKYPKVHLSIIEVTTGDIVSDLKMGHLDAGILATPLGEARILEEPLFNEPFCIYHSQDLSLGDEGRALRIKDLPLEQIVVMNEGHCLRNQVFDLCKLDERSAGKGFVMETGSVTTLLKVIDQGPYFTILPRLCLQDLPKKKLAAQVKPFAGSIPFREVGLVTFRRDLKREIARALKDVLLNNVPATLGLYEDQQPLGKLLPP